MVAYGCFCNTLDRCVWLVTTGVVESSFTFLTYSIGRDFLCVYSDGVTQKTLAYQIINPYFCHRKCRSLVAKSRASSLGQFRDSFGFERSLPTGRALLRVIGLISGLGIYGLIFYYGKYLTKVTFMLDVPSDPISFIQLFASELAFPYLSLIKSIEMGGQWRCFLDVLLAILYVFVNPFIVVFSGSPLDLGPQRLR